MGSPQLYHKKVEECAQLQAQLASYETQLTQAVKGADEAAQYIRELHATLAQAVKDNRMLRETVDARDKYVEQLQQQLAQCQQERDELSGRYKFLVKFYDNQVGTPCEQIRHAQQVEQLQQDLARLKQERDHFEYKYHELAKAAGDDIDTLKQDLARLRDKVEMANAALGEHPDTEIGLAARISELRDEGRAYFHENTKLREQLRLAIVDQAQTEAECYETSANLDKRRGEVDRLRQELEAKYDEMNEREAFHASCANEAEELRVALREENATLRQRVGELEQENAALAKTIDEVAR